ncbi:AT-rich interactive domain-containing protein 3B, partial [Galemys pyrenaicus]
PTYPLAPPRPRPGPAARPRGAASGVGPAPAVAPGCGGVRVSAAAPGPERQSLPPPGDTERPTQVCRAETRARPGLRQVEGHHGVRREAGVEGQPDGARRGALGPQRESLDPVCLLGCAQVQSHANWWVKLEAVMEPLQPQKQQQQQQPPTQQPPHLAPLQMDAREKQGQQMREAQFLYTQKLVTQQTLLSATPGRPSGSPALGPLARVPPATAVARVFERSNVNSEPEEEEGGLEDEEGDDDVEEVSEKEGQAASKYFHMQKVVRQDPRAAPISGLLPAPGLPPHGQQAKEDHTKDASKASPSVSSGGQPSWNLDERLKQNGGLAWSDDADGGRGREISRDFAKLYELDSDPERKEFLDDLFVFMQKRGTPINRIPIMAKQILDLYMLYKLVTEKGGLVEIINKKIWREITKGLNLPTSITSAAFTLRTQYMKYLYAYECEKKALSSPAELQAAIDGNRREGRRPSYSSSLFSYSPAVASAASGASALLSPPKIRFPILGMGSSSGPSASSPRISPATTLRKGLQDPGGRREGAEFPVSQTWREGRSWVGAASLPLPGDGVPVTPVPVPNRLAVPVTLAGQQAGTRTATLEQLRERLESGEPPEKKASRLSEEEQRLVQQALQRNFLSMARQLPMKIRINGRAEDRTEASAAALNLTTSSIGSINMSVDIDGTTYTARAQCRVEPRAQLESFPGSSRQCRSSASVFPSAHTGAPSSPGVLFAQKPVVHLIAGSAPQSVGSSTSSSSSSHCSPSPTSSRGTPRPSSPLPALLSRVEEVGAQNLPHLTEPTSNTVWPDVENLDVSVYPPGSIQVLLYSGGGEKL